MRIIVCDDDRIFAQSFAKQLKSTFAQQGTNAEIVVSDNGVQALREITRTPTDVLFLDIDMPEKDGFSVAGELQAVANKPLIVFLSSLEHLVYQAFAFQPFWFLRKAHLEDLPQAVEKIVQTLSERQAHYTFSVNGSNMRAALSDILYFESESHYITAHLKTQNIRFKGRMGDIEKDLLAHAFVRCHIGYLVNCRFIEVCSRTNIVLTNGEQIPVSRAKAERTQAAFMSYMGSLRP